MNVTVIEVPLHLIDPSPYQPRREFDEAKLTELADSIRRHKVIEPIIVRADFGRFQLIAGERRVRASRLAGRTTIPSIIRVVTDEEAEDLAAVENLNRADLTPMDEADLYARYVAKGLTLEQVAGKFSKTRADVEFRYRLTKLRPEYQEAIRRKILPLPQGCDLARLPQELQPLMFRKIVAGADANEVARQVTAMLDLQKQETLPVDLGDPKTRETVERFRRTLHEIAAKLGRCYSKENVALLGWVYEGPIETNLQLVGMIRRQLGEIEDAMKRAKARRTVQQEMAS